MSATELVQVGWVRWDGDEFHDLRYHAPGDHPNTITTAPWPTEAEWEADEEAADAKSEASTTLFTDEWTCPKPAETGRYIAAASPSVILGLLDELESLKAACMCGNPAEGMPRLDMWCPGHDGGEEE